MTMTAEKYIESLRSKEKRAYAESFWQWLANKKSMPPSPGYALSWVQAQDVRLKLQDFYILKGE